MQQFKALCRHCSLKGGVASDVAAGMIEALNKANLDRIGPERKDDWDSLGRCEHEAGVKTADVCRKCVISSATFYKWKAKYGGLEVSDAKRLKSLEDENAKLKRLLAEAMLDNAMLKDVAAKKW
jgi:putative transposase